MNTSSAVSHVYSRFRHNIVNIKNTGPSTLGVYVIYVENRKDHITETLRPLTFPHVWFARAILPSDLTAEEYDTLSLTSDEASSIYNQPSKLAVHMSYMMCLYHAILQRYENVLLFEDDIYFACSVQQFTSVVNRFCQERIYDVCYLGYCLCRECENIVPDNSSNNITFLSLPPRHFILCKHAIIYSVAYVRQIFNDLLPLTQPSDHVFNRTNIQHGGKVSIPSQALVFQDRKNIISLNGNNHVLHLFIPPRTKK